MIHHIFSQNRDGAEKAAFDMAHQLSMKTKKLAYPQNVAQADGTLILAADEIFGEVAQVIEHAEKLHKPCLVLDLNQYPSPQLVVDWVTKHRIHTLNITGPDENVQPGIYWVSYEFLIAVFAPIMNA